jgi:thymidylate synthase ThyX
MHYKARILADSIGYTRGERLTTFEIVFPRLLLAEVNTHRMLSRNSASSRAIPPKRQIELVQSTPFVPDFYKREKGMAANDPLEPRLNRRAKVAWLDGRDRAVEIAERLISMNVDKAHVNRVLEPYMWHTCIVSGTEWANFFALRAHEGAQPEFQIIARKMQEAIWASEPEPLEPGEWHLPMLEPGSELAEARTTKDYTFWAAVSAGRVARVSFERQNEYEPTDASVGRTELLTTNGHWSPTEHPAEYMENAGWSGNFRGFKQFRKFFEYEDNFADLQAHAQLEV